MTLTNDEKIVKIDPTRKRGGRSPGPQSAPQGDLVTEDNAASRFASLYEGRLKFCRTAGAWLEWTGVAWRKDDTGLAFHWARENARQMTQSKPDKVKAIGGRAAFAKGVETFARCDPRFAVTREFWDPDPLLLGTPGGTVDLPTGITRAAVPDEGISKLTAVAPAEVADCPLWLRFLNEATASDDALIRFLQRWCGYALTGRTREHALVFVYGPGGNGKSVFLNVLTGILKDYAATAAMDTFTASQSDKHSTDLAMLDGARLVTASETDEGRAWAEAKIKAMTGGDPITARFMRRDNFTFRPRFKLIVVGNHRPVLKNVDDAARRRFRIVPFVVKPANPDRDLEEKLKAEWPGILRWMIEGCLDWQANGLGEPESVTKATADYFSEQDTFGQWLADACDCELDNTHKRELSADLLDSWRTYCLRAGEIPTAGKTFAAEMEKRGFTRWRSSDARGFSGIRLRHPNNQSRE